MGLGVTVEVGTGSQMLDLVVKGYVTEFVHR